MYFISDIYEFKKSFRNIEKLTLKCGHLKNAVKFNQTCLNNGIFPNYCHIYCHGIASGLGDQNCEKNTCTLCSYSTELHLSELP